MAKCPNCGGKLKAFYYPVPIGGWRCVLFCDKSKYELIVINQVDDEKTDLIQDFISIITSFCARIYGQRRCKRKTEKLIEELNKKDD